MSNGLELGAFCRSPECNLSHRLRFEVQFITDERVVFDQIYFMSAATFQHRSSIPTVTHQSLKNAMQNRADERSPPERAWQGKTKRPKNDDVHDIACVGIENLKASK